MRSKEKKNTKKFAPPKTHHEIHSRAATATNSRHASKHVPRVNPHSPASIDPGFVVIGLVQLSQSVKTTNVTHTHTQTNLIVAPCTHPGMKRLFRLKAKNGLGRFAPSALPHYQNNVFSGAFRAQVEPNFPHLGQI